MVAEYPGFHFQRCVLTQPQHIQLVFAYINANKCHLSIPPLVYAASSRLGRARIPYRLRERSEPDLRRRVIALRSATGLRPTKVLVANQHSGRDTRSTASVRTATSIRTRGGCSCKDRANEEIGICCRSTASVQKPPAPFAPGACAPTRTELTRRSGSAVGAPPRCENRQPHSHPGRVLLQGQS